MIFTPGSMIWTRSEMKYSQGAMETSWAIEGAMPLACLPLEIPSRYMRMTSA